MNHDWNQIERARVEELLGKTIRSIVVNEDRDEIHFFTEDNEKYVMYHEQDCC